jgi:hypothetical protein
MASVKIINGAIAPDHATALAVVSQFVDQLRADPQRLVAFRSNPRGALGALGLNEDIQNEVMVDAATAKEADCLFTCVTTCWFTDCAITNINVN